MQRYLTIIFLVVLLLAGCQSSPDTKLSSGRLIDIDSTTTANPETEAFIEPLRDSVEAVMNEVIGKSTDKMVPRKPETPLSNFVADLIREAAAEEINEMEIKDLPVIAVINIKGLRAPLPEGEIEVKDIFALMPFENQMVILEHTGEEIRDLFRHMGESNGDGLSGGAFIFSGGAVKKARINGQPLNEESNYYVATSDYLAEGGDHYDIFSQASEKHISSGKIRDLIIDHIRDLTEKGKPITPLEENRITIK
ncbi:MAG: 5'-nucleotidase C-terminal domain-containing protein [Marinilabilia sp.]